MGYREDYYKFTHYLMPYTVFKFGKLLVYRAMRNEKLFIENLKKTWSSIELEKQHLRNAPPKFECETIQLNAVHTAIIISIPEAIQVLEAVYIAIVCDLNDNFRYFTYEIAENNIYFLCEWTQEWHHVNCETLNNRDKSEFIKNLSNLLVLELL